MDWKLQTDLMVKEEWSNKSKQGHSNFIFSFTGPTDPNFSKIRIKTSQKDQICICKTSDIIQSCSNNKKKRYNFFRGLQKMEKAKKWSQELFAFSFVVPSFQSHLSLITKSVLRNLHLFAMSSIAIYKVLYDTIYFILRCA